MARPAQTRPQTLSAPSRRGRGRVIAFALCGVLVVAACVVWGAGFLLRRGQNGAAAVVPAGPPVALPPADDPRALARGAHVVEVLGACTGCHGPALRGGPSPALAGASAPDLVGGRAAGWSLEARAAAVRDCVTPDGALLAGMPCDQHAALALSDLSAALAAIERWPQRQTPPPAGPPASAPPPAHDSAARRAREPSPPPIPPVGVAAQGRYLYATMCAGCHGPLRATPGEQGLALAQPAPGQPDPLQVQARAPGGVGLDGVAAPPLGGEVGRRIDPDSLDAVLRGDRPGLHPLWVLTATAGLRADEVTALWGVVGAEIGGTAAGAHEGSAR